MKNFKISTKQRFAWRRFFNLPPDKKVLRLWNKHFRAEIYRNVQTFAFQMLRECSYWVPRNVAVQMFFLAPTRNMFLPVLWEYILFKMINELSFVKQVRFFASFCWLLLAPNVRFLIIYFLVQISFFETVLGHFSKHNFENIYRQPTMVADNLTQCPTIIKLSTALNCPYWYFGIRE